MNAMYTLKRALILVMVLILTLGVMPLTAMAATYTDEIELEVHSIILVDRSGSIKNREKVDAILQEINPNNEIPEVNFDSRGIVLDQNYVGGGDSPICEAIDDVVGDFKHIILVTDGEQWPQKYDALGIYRNIDLRIILTEEVDKESQALLDQLQLHMVDSTLKVQLPSGEEIVLMDDYKPETYTVEIEIPDPVIEDAEPEDEEDPGDEEPEPGPGVLQIVNCNHECTHKCKWWCWLALPIAILALLLALLHWLLGLRGGWFGPVSKKVKKGAKMLLDVSGSMSNYASSVVKAAKKGKAESIVAFGETVQEVELDEVAKLNIGGATHGVEALKLAAANGWEEIVLVSDLQFNGEALNASDFSQKFKCITVLAPNPYNMNMVTELQQIADRVEVLSL